MYRGLQGSGSVPVDQGMETKMVPAAAVRHQIRPHSSHLLGVGANGIG
jgi:hypothetical protein